MLVTERERLREELVEPNGKTRPAAKCAVADSPRGAGRALPHLGVLHAGDCGPLDIHPVEVHSVVSFYSFSDEGPQGPFVIRLCRTVTCDMAGKEQVARQLENDLGIRFGETTADGKFSLRWANCLGMCDQGPALLVNDQIHTRITAEKVHGILEKCRRAFGMHAPHDGKEHRRMTRRPGPEC